MAADGQGVGFRAHRHELDHLDADSPRRSTPDLPLYGVTGLPDRERRAVMELNVRPVPIPDPVSAFYWDHAKEGKLAVQGFEGTDILQHPPSPVPEVPGGPGEGVGDPIAVPVS